MTIAEALAAAMNLHGAGNLQQAEAIYRQILQVDPAQPDAIHYLGVIAHQVGRQDLAIEYMKKSIELQPLNENYYGNLGLAYQAIGKLNEAASAYRQALELRANYPEALINLASVLSGQGRPEEAVLHYERALRLTPNNADGHNNLGVALQMQGKLVEAEMHCREAVRLKPDHVEALNNLANTQRAQGKLEEAVINFQKALSIMPNFVMALDNLGSTHQLQEKLDEAVACHRRALQIKPDFVQAHSNLATVLQAQGKLDEAEEYLRQALKLQPNFVNGLNNLAGVLQLQGKLKDAESTFAEALRLNPDDAAIASNLLLCLNYDPKIDKDALFSEHRRWGERFGQVSKRGPAANPDRDPARRLRIGYTSPKLTRTPSIASFMEPVLTNHDHNQFDVYCYVEVPESDDRSGRLESLNCKWRVVRGLNNEAAADLIRADGIDILIDLAGHTLMSRLRVFAHKPAPVQVTYLGYPNTTGMTTVDYLVTDAVADPPGEPAGYSEELIRLPNGFSCYAPAVAAPKVGPLPASRHGYVTFGSLHELTRLTEEMLDLWAKLLRNVPTAHLLVFRHSLQGKVKDNLRRSFLNRGIEPERLELGNTLEGMNSFLEVYGRVDISLDTFPWSGHTTACDSMWMGVPVVTLRGPRHAARRVASVLTQVGLTDLIGETPEQYLGIAASLANDRERLAHLRSTLRDQMGNSPLCDGKGFTRSLEAAYREMWKRWCSSTGS